MTNIEKELLLKIVKKLAVKQKEVPNSKGLTDYDAGYNDGQRDLLLNLQKELLEKMD